jgi:glucokinase
MNELLERIPVKVVLHPEVALLGAARHASSALGESRGG